MMQGNIIVVIALDGFVVDGLKFLPPTVLEELWWIRDTIFWGGICALGVIVFLHFHN